MTKFWLKIQLSWTIFYYLNLTLFPCGNWQPKCLKRHGLSAWIDLSFCIKAKFLARSQIFFQHLGVHSSWKLGLFVLRKVCIRKTPIFYAAIFQCNLIDVKVNTFPIRCFVTEWVPVIKAGWKKSCITSFQKVKIQLDLAACSVAF